MLDILFHPKSVAVVGASADPAKVGHAVVKNLKHSGYRGRIFPVNPRSREVLGLKTYPSLRQIKDPVDVVVIAIPAAAVPGALMDCAGAGIGFAVILSAGFRESGAEGARLEEEIRAISQKYHIRVLGPNCLGVISTPENFNATFAAGMLPKGRIAFFSQSGALGIAILDWAIGNKMGFSRFISLGNKVDLHEIDFIEYFLSDTETDVILGYIEDVVDGKKFLEVAGKATKRKPVILIKSGGTQAGARAASSHTGALAGSETAFRAAFQQTGIIRAEGVQDLFETAMAFTSNKLPAGNNLLIVTNAGGPGIIAADAAEKIGINLPYLSKRTIDKLASVLPKNASLYNPVDIIGDAGSNRYAAVLDTALHDPNVDGFLVLLTPQAIIDVEDTARKVVDAAKRTDKPLIACFMGEERVRAGVTLLRASGVANYPYPEPAVRAFKKLFDHCQWTKKERERPPRIAADREAARKIIQKALQHGQAQLAEDDSREILSQYGFGFPVKYLAVNPADAAAAASRIGFPVVMKISSPDILHKTDIGGVRLDIRSKQEAREAFEEITFNARRYIPSAFVNGVAVYETVSGGKEVILGITYDRTFGHMIMFGLGGIYVEALKDISFRIAPLGMSDAHDMIREIRAYPLLEGVRGEKPVDKESIVRGIVGLSQLASDFPMIRELDINPLVVAEHGATALDARIIISYDDDKGGM